MFYKHLLFKNSFVYFLDIHENSFVVFIVSSWIYMLLQMLLLRWGISYSASKNPPQVSTQQPAETLKSSVNPVSSISRTQVDLSEMTTVRFHYLHLFNLSVTSTSYFWSFNNS